MNIGIASEKSNLPAKTIRYYEDIRLIKPDRSENGYRYYSMQDVHRLRFVQRARSLGFTVNECRQLLSLYDHDKRSSASVRRIANSKLAEIRGKIRELRSFETTLKYLVDHCSGDDRPDCPIIDNLSGNGAE